MHKISNSQKSQCGDVYSKKNQHFKLPQEVNCHALKDNKEKFSFGNASNLFKSLNKRLLSDSQ